MARYKVLKGVAYNIGHSFTSLMNYTDDDYSMGHILRFARESGLNTLTIDLMTGEGQPALLLRAPISKLPDWYTKMFWNLVTSSGSDSGLVQSAVLTLKYDLQRTKLGQNGIQRNPYSCDVSIVDIRGKTYRAHFEDWWFVDRFPIAEVSRRWWNPFNWFRRGR